MKHLLLVVMSALASALVFAESGAGSSSLEKSQLSIQSLDGWKGIHGSRTQPEGRYDAPRLTTHSFRLTFIFQDDFDGTNDTTALKARGYKVHYRGSGPQGTAPIWFQGNPAVFPAYNGPTDGYVGSNFNSVTATNRIDNWLVLPALNVTAGDSLVFRERSPSANPYPDSIKIMYSAVGDSVPEAGSWVQLAYFRTTETGSWGRRAFAAPTSGATGRFAIRYFVINGGPTGTNSNYIGIDAITVGPGVEPVDIVQVPVVYALGKMPIPYGNPQTISAPVSNVSGSSVTFNLTLTVKDSATGTVRFTNTQAVTNLAGGATQVVSFAPWSPAIQEKDSIVVQTSVVAGEDVTMNNRAAMLQIVNSNRFSYSQGPTPSGGVGFTGATGDFVAKFSSGTSAVIDSVQVNFTSGGQPYGLGLWDATGTGGTPGTNIYTSSPLTSATGIVTIPITPPVLVNGYFYVGVKQTGTTNIGFAFQSESPIRSSTFYYTTPTGGTSWTDFSPGAEFRLMIEPNIAPGSPMAYSSSTTIQDTTPVLPNTTNQRIIGIQVVTTGNLLPISATSFSLNTTGTTNASDISNAKLFYTGGSSTFAPTNQFGSTVAVPSGSYVISGSQSLLSGTNYFWLTYDIPSGATVGNHVDAGCTSVTVAGTPQTPTITAPSGDRQIKNALAGDYTVGSALFSRILGRELTFERSTRKVLRDVPVATDNAGTTRENLRNLPPATSLLDGIRTQHVEVEEEVWTMMDHGKPFVGRQRVEVAAADRAKYGLSDHVLAVYPTITAALVDLNALGVAGPVQFLLVDPTYTTETYPLTINQVPGASATNTIKIRPQTSVTTTISGSSASCIFKLNGADYITFDGSNSGGTDRSMTIANTNTSTSSSVIWMASIASPRDSTTNNTVKNCIISGSSATITFIGIVTSGATLGGVADAQNNNLTIRNNAISKCYYGVASVGPTGNQSDLLITQNTIGGTDTIGFNGIAAFQQRNAQITKNIISKVVTASIATASGIRIAGTADSVLISGNVIDDIRNRNTDGWGSNGIQLNSSVAAAKVTVVNNFIRDVASVGFDDGTVLDNGYGIIAVTGGGYKIYHNSVNLSLDQDSLGGRPAAMQITAGVPAGSLNIRNNIFKNGQTVGTQRYAIYSSAGDTVYADINYNDYTASGANLGFLGSTNRADLAAWRVATGKDANSKSADPLFLSNSDLHITNPSSPASNAGTPLAEVTDDFDGDPRSLSQPDMGGDEFAGGSSTVTLGVPVAVNWNIVSLPVSAPVPDDSVKHLYTNSVNDYAFDFSLPGPQYHQQYRMANGPGYWIKSSITYTQNITGTQRDTLTVPVSINWNMIGSISTSIDTSAAHVTPTPANLRGSNYFKYLNGYVVVTTIEPGLGYWVKANSAGSFFMHATGPAKRSGEEVAGRSIEDLNSITIQDANGGSQTLYFGADANGEIPVSMFAMPPAPPVGSFDARFASSEDGLMVQTHPAEVNTVIDLPITIQSNAYPLTVMWKVTDGSYELSDGIGGLHPVRGEGALKITNSAVQNITLKVTGGSGLPKEFALSQNYPNPFNPTTSIKYALPVDSRVTMDLYNIIGQRVRTLVNDNVAAGYHLAEWDGTGNAGRQLASGVYFLQMSAKGTNGKSFNEVRKLMMLK